MSRVLRTHWRGAIHRNYPHLHPEVQEQVLAVLGLDRLDDLGLMKTSNREAKAAASLVDTWGGTLQVPSEDRLRAEAERLQPFCGTDLTSVLLASDDLNDLRAALTLLRWRRKNGRAPRVVTPAPPRRSVRNRVAASARAKRLAEEAVESEWRRRQEVRERREFQRESDEIPSPEPPAEEVEEDRPVCDGCGKKHKNFAYEVGGGLMCGSCARVWLNDLRSAEAVARRASLPPAVEVVEVSPVVAEKVEEVVEAAAVERPKPAEVAVPRTCASAGCQRPVFDRKGPFRNAHGLSDGLVKWADGKEFCYECRGKLIARIKRLLAQRARTKATPPLERREPLAAGAGIEERVEVQPAVATATA